MVQTAQRFFCLSFALCLTVSCVASPNAVPPTPAPTETSSVETAVSPINQIAEAYLKLRPIKGQFNGGSWHDAVDPWMGEKHRHMLALQQHIDNSDSHQEGLLSLLGEPDQTVTGGDPLFEQLANGLTDETARLEPVETAVSSQDELLIYEWRGTHDFLYFVNREGTIIHSGWWHAGE